MLQMHVVDRIRDITTKQAILEKRKALKEYRELKQSSKVLCQTHLEDLAEAKAAIGNVTKASAICQLKFHDHQRAMAHHIRYIYGASCAGGVSSVLAPDETGTLVEMTSKSDMEQAIMTENESKFLQAVDTPFMQPNLLGDFGYLGIGTHVAEVMDGTYEIPYDMDLYTKKFIRQLEMEPAIKSDPPIRTYFMTDEWKKGWSKAKE
jgi:hypothetical protein